MSSDFVRFYPCWPGATTCPWKSSPAKLPTGCRRREGWAPGSERPPRKSTRAEIEILLPAQGEHLLNWSGEAYHAFEQEL
jgi:hypothetical protein